MKVATSRKPNATICVDKERLFLEYQRFQQLSPDSLKPSESVRIGALKGFKRLSFSRIDANREIWRKA
ncbi:MAG: hypothetical protein COB46_03310 [Rhodospirillaceae bacterium]|nr:MAG: hypothetical protein COB46_03310 [Rhodospirillaceae bacterium]